MLSLAELGGVSEEVTLHLVKSKCLPILLYGLECYSLLKADLHSLDFVVMRFLMKLFRTANKDIIDEYVAPSVTFPCHDLKC